MAEGAPVPGDPVQVALGRCIELAVQHMVCGHHNVPGAGWAMVQRGAQLWRLLVDLVDPLLRLCVQDSSLCACAKPVHLQSAACQCSDD